MARKSVLFSPGDEPEKLRKATKSGADVVVFDLEDAVALDAKADARETVRDALADVRPADCEVCVRVNPVGEGARDDLVVFDGPLPDSVMLPKTADADDVEQLSSLLAEFDAELPILALIESAAGVLHAEAIAAAAPTDALVFGAEDLAGDIGATRTAGGQEVEHARQHVVLAARAVGISPIDTVYTDFNDDDGLHRDAQKAVRLGYDGKLAIHPAQVPILNDVFTPGEDRIEWAERLLDARDSTDSGVFAVDGEMVDAPMVKQAERVLSRAGLLDERRG